VTVARAAALFVAAAHLSAWSADGAARAATLALPGDAGAPSGQSTTVSIQVDDAAGILGTDLVITYNPSVAEALEVTVTGLSAGHTLFSNLSAPGVIRIVLYGVVPLSGSGPLLDVLFTSTGPTGSMTAVRLESAGLNEGAITAVLMDGQYCVQGLAAEVRNVVVALNPGSTTVILRWDADPFASDYRVYHAARRDLGDLACLTTVAGDPAAGDDGAVPAIGAGFYYLVTASNCRGESSLGMNSSGIERANPAPCP